MPPRIVTLSRTLAPEGARGARDRHGRSTVRPSVDWTGHQYKTEAELRINYNHRGREAIRGGKSDQRTHPAMPG